MTQNFKRLNPETPPTQKPPTQKPPTQKPPTPGQQYVKDFLPELSQNIDPDWFAENIDAGNLIACPRCAFLCLPFLVFPGPDMTDRGTPAPIDSCDVCAILPAVCRFPLAEVPNMDTDLVAALTSTLADVASERRARAEALWQLYLSAANSADALFVARIAQARQELAALARTPTHE